MRLMLVEEDEAVGAVLVKHLGGEGHAVDWVRSDRNLDLALDNFGYDFLLLGMQHIEMLSPCQLQSYRAVMARIPSVVISVWRVLVDKVAILDLGADDVLVKPVDLSEVSARIRAITRRGAKSACVATEIRHGLLTFDPTRRVALWKDEYVALTKREYRILEVLVRNRNQVVSRFRLEEALYSSGDGIGSNAVEVYIHHLRRKTSPKLIVTSRGLGYQLAPASLVRAESRVGRATTPISTDRSAGLSAPA